MSMPQEHDYIGLSEAISTSDKILSPCSEAEKNSLNLKETELRLGLPGLDPDLRLGAGVSLGTNGFSHKGFVSGAKRGFSDAINSGSGKWGLSINGGSEVDLGKEGLLFSPRGGCKTNNSNGNNSNSSGNSVKEIASPVEEKKNESSNTATPALKAQVVGWPPVRSFRKNTLAPNLPKNNDLSSKSMLNCLYVKVSMDGAPYLRKIDLKTYRSYAELSSALEKMFSCFTIGQYGQGVSGEERLTESHLKDLLHGSEYVLTYEDKDGDWMLVGDVPWEMFTDSCKRLRIMKGSDAIGLAPRTMEKSKNHN